MLPSSWRIHFYIIVPVARKCDVLKSDNANTIKIFAQHSYLFAGPLQRG